MSPAHRRTPSLALAAVALVAAGCGTSSSSGTAGPPAPGGRTGTPTGTPTAPAYAPATGPRVRLPGLTLRAPAGWTLDRGFGPSIVSAGDPHLRDVLTFSDTAIYPGTSLTRAARIVARDDTWRQSPHSLRPVTIDDARFFHLAGPAAAGSWYDVYGRVVGDRLLELAFRTVEPRAARERLTGSVLETLRVR